MLSVLIALVFCSLEGPATAEAVGRLLVLGIAWFLAVAAWEVVWAAVWVVVWVAGGSTLVTRMSVRGFGED